MTPFRIDNRVLTGLLGWSVWLLLVSVAVGQPPQSEQQQTQPGAAADRYEHIYVPEQDAGLLWSLEEGVLLDRQEFEALVKQVSGPVARSTGQPGGIVVEQIRYAARIDGDLLEIEAICQLTKLTPGWAELTLPLRNVAVRRATLGDVPAPLGLTGEKSQLTLLDRFVGRRELRLTLTTPLTRTGTDELASFSVFPQAASQLQLTLPAGRQLQVNGTTVTREQNPPEEREVSVPIGGLDSIQLRLTDAVGDSVEESLVFALTEYHLGVERQSVNWQASCFLSLYGKRFNELQFVVPGTLEMTSVEASGLQSWLLKDDPENPGSTRIVLSFREALPEQIPIKFAGIQLMEEGGRWQVAPLRLLGATTHTGGLVVSSPRELRLKPVSLAGIRPTRRVWKPMIAPAPDRSVAYFDVWEEAFELVLTTTPATGEVQGAVSHVLNVDDPEVTVQSVVTLQTLFAPLFELNLELPPRWDVDEIRVGEAVADWQRVPGAPQQLRVPVVPALKPGEQRTWNIRLRWKREAGTFDATAQRLSLPDLNLRGVSILEGTYTITASPLLDVIPEQISGMDPALIGLPGERLGFRYQDSIISGELSITRKTARFNAQTVQVFSADDQMLGLRLRTTLDIRGGGLRTVALEVHDVPLQEMEFVSRSDVRIVEQRREATETGVRWLLTLDRYVTGVVPLELTTQWPRPEGEDVAVPSLTVENAELQEQFLAFSARPEQRLLVDLPAERASRLEAIDPGDVVIPFASGEGRIVKVYHTSQTAARLRARVETFAAESIPGAIGHRLEVSTILEESGVSQQQARLTFSSVGMQTLLLQLPEGGVLWSTLLNGQPVTARASLSGIAISLAGLNSDSRRNELTLLYALPPASTRPGIFRETTLPSPRFAVVDGQGQALPLSLLQTDWQVHHAADARVEVLAVGVQRISGGGKGDWLESWWRQLWQQSAGELLWNLIIGGAVCVLALAIGRGIRKLNETDPPAVGESWWTWQRRLLAALGVAVVVVVGFLLLMPTVQVARDAGQRYEVTSGESHTRIHGSDEVVSIRDFDAFSEPTSDFSSIELSTKPEGAGLKSQTRRNIPQSQEMAELAKKRSGIDSLAPPPRPQAYPNAAAATNPFGSESEQGSGMGGAAPPATAPNFANTPNRFSRTDSGTDGTAAAPPAEPQNALADAKPAGKSPSASDGLLSLPLTQAIPENLTNTDFRTLEHATAELPIRYVSGTVFSRLRWVLMLGVLLLMWLIRRARVLTRVLFGLAGLGLSLALPALLPVAALPVWEGLILGLLLGFAAWLLAWCGSACVRCCRGLCHRPTVQSLTTVAVLLTLLPLTAAAQEKSPPPAAAKLAITTGPEKIPLVYPYADINRPLAADRVFVPRAEYLRLWKLAHPEDLAEPSPQEVQIHEAIYVARYVPAEGAGTKPTIELNGRYAISLHRSAATVVPLPIQNVLTDRIEIDGKSAAATAVGNRQPAVLLPGPGLHIVDARFQLPAEVFGTAGVFQVDLLPSASGSIAFRLPDAESQVKINEGKLPFQRIERDGGIFAEVGSTPGGTLSFAWQPKTNTSRLQFLACDSTREVFVRERGIELQYVFDLQIAQGSFSEVEFALPEGIKLKSLTGADLSGWQLTDEGTLRVLLKRAVEDRSQLQLSLFQPLDLSSGKTQVTLADVVPQKITREIGTWAIGWEDALGLRFVKTDGVRQLALPQYRSLAATPLLKTPGGVFRFTGRPQEIVIEIERKQAELTATHYTVVDLQRHKTHLATMAEIKISGEPKLSVELALPTGMQIVEVTASALDDWFVTSSEPGTQPLLTVLLREPQQGTVQVIVRGHIPHELEGVGKVDLLPLQVQGTREAVHYLGVGAAELYGLSIGGQAGWQSVDPTQLPGPLRGMANFPIRLGFLQRSGPVAPVQLVPRREVATVRGDSICLIAVTDVSIDYGLSLRWTIAAAATDRFYAVAPEWFSERIEWQSDEIRQVRSQPLENGQRLWTIETHEPRSREFFVTAVVSLPHPADRRVSAPKLRLVTGPPAGAEPAPALETQSHYVALVNLGREPLEAISEHAAQLVPLSALPFRLPSDLVEQAAEIVTVTPQIVPTWELKPLEEQSSPAATVPLAEMTTTLAAGGGWRTSAIFHVRNRQRQFLPLELPPESRVLAVLVNDIPTRLMRHTLAEGTVWLVPLPPAGAADLSYPVQIVLEGSLPATFGTRWSPWPTAATTGTRLPCPTVLSPERSSELGIPVLHTVWKLSLADDFLVEPVTGDQTNMTPSQRSDVVRLVLQNRKQEISELSRLMSSRSSSVQQRQQAVQNLKQLRDVLSRSLPDSADADGNGEQLESQRHDLYLHVESTLQESLQQNGAPAEEQEQRQSRGRDYILQNNDLILNENTVSHPRGTSELQRQKAGSAPESRIVIPQLKDKAADERREKQIERKSDTRSDHEQSRKLLREENLRQNFMSQSQQSAQPMSGEPSDKGDDQLQNFSGGMGGGMGGGMIELPRRASDREAVTRDPYPALGLDDNTFRFAPGQSVQTDSPPSRSSGSLGLELEMPLHESTQVYSKVGGHPVLEVRAFPRPQRDRVIGILWAVGIGLITLFALISLPRLTPPHRWRTVCLIVATLGLLVFVTSTSTLSGLGLTAAALAACTAMLSPIAPVRGETV